MTEKTKKITISIPEIDYSKWLEYSKRYGSFSHFVRECISEFVKTRDDVKSDGLIDIILEQRDKFDQINQQLIQIKATVLQNQVSNAQKQNVEEIMKLRKRFILYLEKVGRASDKELVEILDIDEKEFLDLTSILLKQNIVDALKVEKDYYWILKK